MKFYVPDSLIKNFLERGFSSYWWRIPTKNFIQNSINRMGSGLRWDLTGKYFPQPVKESFSIL